MQNRLIILAASVVAMSAAPIERTAAASISLYVVPGVVDSGDGPGSGIATTVMCTNHSGAAQRIEFWIRQSPTSVTQASLQVPNGHTVTASSHNTAAFVEDVLLSPGTRITRARLSVIGTSRYIFCSALIVDASGVPPSFMDALHMVRFSPVSGVHE